MDFVLPPVGEGLQEVELIRWLVKPGETVRRGQSLIEVMSDKATMEVTATFAGSITEILGEPGAKVKVGQLVLRYTGKDANITTTPAPVPQTRSATVANGHGQSATATLAVPAALEVAASRLPSAAPSVRLLARKLGIDLTRVHGSGPAGRILLEDLAGFIKPTPADKNREAAERPDIPALDVGQPGTRLKLLGLRRKIAERMVESTRTIPHFSYIDECDVSDLVRMRTQLKPTFARVGVKLTYLPFFVKAVARALKEVPIVNSTYDAESGEVTMHDRYHVGIAVAAPSGLIVPVIHDADTRDIAALATEIERLSADARSGKAKIEDLRGGTFTITSVGNIGGLASTPIINIPEVGIMGIGKVVKRPHYDAAGNIHPADIVFLSFSFDHRIVDGAVGAMFANVVIKHLQNPAALLLPERFSGAKS